MIAFLAGEVAWVGADEAVIDVGGVGMTVLCSSRTLAGLRVGERRRVATSLVVREDSLTLFGFGDEDERRVFEILQSVSGIGPRIAQAMLGVLTPDEIRAAVAGDDLNTLCRTPGVGRKGAARIALELKDKLGAPTASQRPAAGVGQAAPGWQEQVVAGLVALGWPAREATAASEAVAPLAKDGPDGRAASVSELLRAALRHLDRA